MIKFLSVIVPVHNEEQNVPILSRSLCDTLDGMHIRYEIIFVDDGSSDRTFAAIENEALRVPSIVGVRLRRNFGQTMAIQAGFDQAKGDICVTLDGDLQHDPAYIPLLLAKIDEGHDLVCSYREQRNDGVVRRIPSKLANWLARKLSSVRVRDFGSTFRAYRTDVVREIAIYGDMHRFIPVFVSMISSRISEIPIRVSPRLHGKSNYGIGRTFRVVSDLIVLLFFSKFFSRPSHIFGYIAFVLGLPGILGVTMLAVRKLIFGVPILVNGPLFMLSVFLCLMAGQLFTTGIVCEYLVRILYDPGRSRPYSVAQRTVDGDRPTVTARGV